MNNKLLLMGIAFILIASMTYLQISSISKGVASSNLANGLFGPIVKYWQLEVIGAIIIGIGFIYWAVK